MQQRSPTYLNLGDNGLDVAESICDCKSQNFLSVDLDMVVQSYQNREINNTPSNAHSLKLTSKNTSLKSLFLPEW
jgi:hypothetical protein